MLHELFINKIISELGSLNLTDSTHTSWECRSDVGCITIFTLLSYTRAQSWKSYLNCEDILKSKEGRQSTIINEQNDT